MKINGKRFTAGLWDACLGKWGRITNADVIVISETLALVTLSSGLLFQSGILSPSSPSLPTHLTPGGTMSHFLPINLVSELPLLQESWTWGVCGGLGVGVGWGLPGRQAEGREVSRSDCTGVRCWARPPLEVSGDNYCHHTDGLCRVVFKTRLTSTILILLFIFPLLIATMIPILQFIFPPLICR